MPCVTCIRDAGRVHPLQRLLPLQKLPKRSADRRQRKSAHLRNPGDPTLKHLANGCHWRYNFSQDSSVPHVLKFVHLLFLVGMRKQRS